MHANTDVWIIIPVYNEGPVIKGVLEQVLTTFPNVVCVDDGSADNSAAEIAQTGAHLVRHPINMGQGAALQTGLSYAVRRTGGQYFVTFDADGQHRVEDVLSMLEIVRDDRADVVLGSRFLGNSDTVPLIKQIVLRTVVMLVPACRRLKLAYAHNGLRLLGRAAAERVRITQNGMAHASEIAGWLAHSRLRVAEAPVTVLYTDYSRNKGQSLINGINILFDVSMARRGR